MQNRSNWRGYVDRLTYYLKKFFTPVPPSTQAGLGAIPQRAGVTFRVWAPHAAKVFVTGTFNNWSAWHSPLAEEEAGYWSVDSPTAKIGDAYKFVIHHNGHTLFRVDPQAKDVNGEFQNGVICEDTFDWSLPAEAPPYQTPGWHELVIYELHVGTFPENPSNVVGTFREVMAKLPYLKELGINAIELMPLKEFAGAYSWGYNPAHPFAVTRTYGGRVALKELIKAAHAHDIAVIIDVVYNHFGPQDLSMWRFDGWSENDKGGIYFYNDWRSQTPWADTRPDYGRPEVCQFIRDNALMWLEEFHADGLRWDATNFIRNAHGHDGDPGADIAEGWAMMQWVNHEVNEKQPWKIIIAEDMQNNAWLTKNLPEGSGFDSQWDANFAHTIRHAVITPQDEDRDMTAVGVAIAARFNGDALERVLFTESHDEVANGKARVPEDIAPGEADSFFSKKRSTLGAALVFTTPGIPLIFQGQEFLENGWFDDHMPLDWTKSERYSGILQLYRELIHLRRNWSNTTRGLMGQSVNVHHLNNVDKLIAYHRWYEGGPRDDVIVVANFANRTHPGYTIGLPHPGLWRVRFNSDEQRYDPSFSNHFCPDVIAAPLREGNAPIDGLPCWSNVTIAPYSVLILSQD